MEIHKPHPIHSWRELLKEVGIIVLGVLIALGAEQSVAAVRERHIADEARQNILQELQFNLGFIRDRVSNEPCIDRRIDELAALLGSARDGALDPAPTWIGRPSIDPVFSERWQSATASGRSSLFDPVEQGRFDVMYSLLAQVYAHESQEQMAWTQLRTLETWPGPLGPAARLAFAQALQQARYEAWYLKLDATFALATGDSLGIKLPEADKPTTSICLPLNTTRADALRRLGTPRGEP
ncbi:MAG TPA: hypothetical protein VLI40_01825 [Gemmatimonadaceae bacterium]|nr:hypothetical protein [Gemmatimonadaceae bacterium]